jgi:hypothetical protein
VDARLVLLLPSLGHATEIYSASSVSNDPVLHFVLFIPASANTPLYILDHNGEYCTHSASNVGSLPLGNPTTSDAFVLPQWGGIVLLNSPSRQLTSSSLHSTFQTFHRQLLSLLGVPSLPPGVSSNQSDPFTDWQLDALVRQRARQNFENSKETLNSIVALVHQIENMPVGQDVKGDVQDALDALDSVRIALPVPLRKWLTASLDDRPWRQPPPRRLAPSSIQAKPSHSPRARSSTRACSRCFTSPQSTSTLYIPRCLRQSPRRSWRQ